MVSIYLVWHQHLREHERWLQLKRGPIYPSTHPTINTWKHIQIHKRHIYIYNIKCVQNLYMYVSVYRNMSVIQHTIRMKH